MQLKFILPALAALIPLVASTTVVARTSGLKCKSNEFEYKDKNCCLPVGGPKTVPTPPKDTQCPPTSYYWEPKQGCCVPRNPPPTNYPQPQCPKNWTWSKNLYRCTYTPPTPTTTTSRPSSTPGNPGYPGNGGHNLGHGGGKGPGGYHKRSVHKARSSPCPTGLDACPISSLTGDYECFDTATELEACGGCPALGKGQNCNKIEGAWNVGCEQGTCLVYTCAGGFRISPDGKSCIPL